ncbi:MAG: hypothetical protein Q8O56_00360 [Solirubrobacteraceae bacterium]|nr:hypothetical protein [Solirubrobacteraceae bacterium]
MSAGPRIAAFAVLLVATFALAALAGNRIDPGPTAGETAHDDAAAGEDDGHDAGDETGEHAGDETAAPAGGGLRVVTDTTTLTTGGSQRFAFRIVDEQGATRRSFEVEQGRRMHLIVVRRDLRRFQHLHPVQDADGAWSVALRLPDAGVYHAFADFRSDGERHTAGIDLFAAGSFEPLALPAPSSSAQVDGYDVRLHRTHGDSELRFTVSRDGAPVRDLQPYLGARGHLVMLRDGDLAYEHVHPAGSAQLAFETEHAEAGVYRLFLQFRHRDRIRTAAFTYEVRG